jgi:hypothetical protein
MGYRDFSGLRVMCQLQLLGSVEPGLLVLSLLLYFFLILRFMISVVMNVSFLGKIRTAQCQKTNHQPQSVPHMLS